MFRENRELVAAAVEIALFDGFALVVFLFALPDSNNELDMALAWKKLNGNYRGAFDFFAFELGDLLFRSEKFDILRSVATKRETEEPKLVTANRDVSALELRMMIANEANLRAGQNHASFELVRQNIIVAGATIDDSCGWLFWLFHRDILAYPLLLGEFAADFAFEFAMVGKLEAGVDFGTEEAVGCASDGVFEALRESVPGRIVMMNGDGILGDGKFAGHVVLWTEVFWGEGGEFVVAVNTGGAVEFEVVEILSVDRWTVDGFKEGIGGDFLIRVGKFITFENFGNPWRMFFGAKNGGCKPILRFPSGKGFVFREVGEGFFELNVGVEIDATLFVNGIHANNVCGESPALLC